MNMHIPFTLIQPATLISVMEYKYQAHKLEGEYGYGEYLAGLWQQREAFINLEHDCIPWPGAIEVIWDCPEDWCVYDYHLQVHRGRDLTVEENAVPLGLVKISRQLIEKTIHIWEKPIHWLECDKHLTKQAIIAGIRPHQHYPGIVNANPVLLT